MLWCLEALGEEVEALFPLSQYEHSAAAAVEYGGQTIGLDVCLCFCRCLRHGLRIVPSFFPCFCLRVIVVSNLFFLVFRSCVLSQNLVLGSYLKLVFFGRHSSRMAPNVKLNTKPSTLNALKRQTLETLNPEP